MSQIQDKLAATVRAARDEQNKPPTDAAPTAKKPAPTTSRKTPAKEPTPAPLQPNRRVWPD